MKASKKSKKSSASRKSKSPKIMSKRPDIQLQTTIGSEVSLEGIGLHTGNKSKITFRPAPANTGIRFFRSDLPGCPMIPARLGFVVATVRGTNLGLHEAKV